MVQPGQANSRLLPAGARLEVFRTLRRDVEKRHVVILAVTQSGANVTLDNQIPDYIMNSSKFAKRELRTAARNGGVSITAGSPLAILNLLSDN